MGKAHDQWLQAHNLSGALSDEFDTEDDDAWDGFDGVCSIRMGLFEEALDEMCGSSSSSSSSSDDTPSTGCAVAALALLGGGLAVLAGVGYEVVRWLV